MEKPEYGKDFIMKPKIDFAFKEIMMNDEALKGFLSAVLETDPESMQILARKNTNLTRVHVEERKQERLKRQAEKTQLELLKEENELLRQRIQQLREQTNSSTQTAELKLSATCKVKQKAS